MANPIHGVRSDPQPSPDPESSGFCPRLVAPGFHPNAAPLNYSIATSNDPAPQAKPGTFPVFAAHLAARKREVAEVRTTNGTNAAPAAPHIIMSKSNTSNNTLTEAQLAAMPGFDPAQHIGVLGKAPNARHLTQADYDALDDESRTKVQLLAEQLDVQKQRRQAGEATIGKKVVTEQVSVPVSLQHEEVIIHQVTPTGGATGTIGDGQTIKVPISEEVATVSKTAHVTGEVEIEKRVTSEQKTITDTVRHEELDVKQGTTGRVTIQDDSKR